MSKKLATELLMDALKKYGTIYEESLKIAASYEKQNLIHAYFAGAMAMQKNDVDVDSFLNQFNTPPNDTTTPAEAVSN
jgi:hypothetical protein